MSATATATAAQPDHLTVEVHDLTPAVANIGLGGLGVFAAVVVAVGAATDAQAPLAFVAVVLGVILVPSLASLFIGWRRCRALRDGRLDLAPGAITYTCRYFTRTLPTDRVTAVRWYPFNAEVRLVGPDADVSIWVEAFAPDRRDDIVTWVRNRWPQWLHHGWPEWAKRAAARERLTQLAPLGRDRLAPPDPSDPPPPPPTPPTERLDVRTRPRAWIGHAFGALFMFGVCCAFLSAAIAGRPPQNFGDVIGMVVTLAMFVTPPALLCLWLARAAALSRNGRLILDPDWVIYSCGLFTRTLPAGEVTAVAWQLMLGRVRLRGADGVTVIIDFEFFPAAKRYALLTWVRGRFPEGIQKNWSELPKRRFLPPTRRPVGPDAVLPFLYGRGFLKVLLVVASVSLVCGQLFGLFVQRIMPPGQPFIIPLQNLGNRQLVMRDPEDWAVLCAAGGAAITVLFLGAIRVLTDVSHWVSADREDGP